MIYLINKRHPTLLGPSRRGAQLGLSTFPYWIMVWGARGFSGWAELGP
jgi:hypothetical protein